MKTMKANVLRTERLRWNKGEELNLSMRGGINMSVI